VNFGTVHRYQPRPKIVVIDARADYVFLLGLHHYGLLNVNTTG